MTNQSKAPALTLTCGHGVAAPKISAANLFYSQTMYGGFRWADVMLQCPKGCGLKSVAPAAADDSGWGAHVDPWTS